MTVNTKLAQDYEVGVDRLYDYTKFHVGLYASLVFGVVALVGLGEGNVLNDANVKFFATVSVISWVMSGIAGGTILGSLVELRGSLEDFRKSEHGPLGFKVRSGIWWEDMEHRVFWVGVASAMAAFGRAMMVIGQ